MTATKLIHLIADYGVGDPAYAEVVQKFALLTRDMHLRPVNVPTFSTLATGMWIYQLATVNSFPGLVIFSNTAPRISRAEDELQTYKGMFGHFAYTRLDNGVLVTAVHVGWCFSFIKPLMRKFYAVNVPNENSQFRSRDFYPDGVAGLMDDEDKFRGEEIPLSSIPDVPENRISFVDGYGNIKTTIRQSEMKIKSGTRISLTVNKISRIATVAGETYKTRDGDLILAPGSSGGKDRFVEIWIRGGSAWEYFHKPKVETEFQISLVE